MNSRQYLTRSTSNSTSDNTDSTLSHHTKDALDQVKEEVMRVCSVNQGTERKITSLMKYLDDAPTEVGLVVSSYMCALFTTVYTTGYQERTEGA
jgi:hypothetical protein